METANLQFIAINLPDDVKLGIIEIQREIRGLNLPISFVAPRNLQLTVKYFENIDEAKLGFVKEALRSAVGEISRFKLETNGIAIFENKEGEAQFLAFQILPNKVLKKFYKVLCEKLSEAGIADETRFIPAIIILNLATIYLF